MIFLVLAAVLGAQSPDAHVVLTRGAVVRGIPIWDVEDATLDGTKPNENSEGDMDLVGGSLRTILIRFGDIDRVVGANQRIRSATLYLTPSGGDKVHIQSISRVSVPWGEGPFRTLGGFALPHQAAGADNKSDTQEPAAPRGSATWRQRRAGERGVAWEQPGARGGQDATLIEGAVFQSTSSSVRIDGLADAVQKMADHPDEDYGFAITMDSASSFNSSESDTGRPRLELDLEDKPSRKGADLSVVSIEREAPSGKLPAEGQEATYTAHIKNVGDAPAKAFGVTWIVDERPGTTEMNNTSLTPGQETTVVYHLPYRPEKADHRYQTLGIRIRPTGDDANSRNDALTVASGGKALEVVVPTAVATSIQSAPNAMGSQEVEDWVQAEARAFNDVYLARSRFSFAPEGAKERVSVQRVLVGDPASLPAPADGSIRVVVDAPTSDPSSLDKPFLRRIGVALGLADRTLTNVSPANNELAGIGGTDRFPGLMGYGDTRFEGLSPGNTELPYEASPAPIFEIPPIEATGLLAATDVLRLNAEFGGLPPTLPKTILLRAQSQMNVAIPNLKIDFFRSADGKVPKEATPVFSVTTGGDGNALLPSGPETVFGSNDPAPGADGLFARATLNGGTAGSWIKAWQLIDTVARGGPRTRAFSMIDLHFNLPGAELDTATDLAPDRIVTDSAGSLPAKLAPLIDGSNDTEAPLSGKAGDWVEIDLGRDRTIGEIDLVGEAGAFWDKFDIAVYATGQRVEEAALWAKEVDGAWTAANRRDVLSANRVSVPYRGPVVRVRYIRIVNRSNRPGKLAEIRVIPVKNPS